MKTNQLLVFLIWLLMAGFQPICSQTQPINEKTKNPPAWSVDPSLFLYDGEVTGQVFIDSVAVTGGKGILGAFVGDQCRGVKAKGITGPSGKFVFIIRCYSNVASGETMSFKYFDEVTGKIYPIRETVPFVSNMIIGNALKPMSLKQMRAIKK